MIGVRIYIYTYIYHSLNLISQLSAKQAAVWNTVFRVYKHASRIADFYSE